MSATRHIADSWMDQADVQSGIKDAISWGGEWLKVYESRDSYIEHFYGLLVPVSSRWMVKTITDANWGEDMNHSRSRLAKVTLTSRHYLGLRFRRLFALELGPHGYFSVASGITEHVVRREVHDRDTGKSDVIFIRREAVLRFLQSTSQVLLWCVRSQRYSERSAEELGFEIKQDWFRHEGYCYVFESMNLGGRLKVERPRMATATQVFGKGIVRLTNEECPGL